MLYWSFRLLLIVFFAVVYRWKVIGRGNIPVDGPFILCANHLSWMDPPLVGCAVTRKVHFMAKEELFRNPLWGKLFRRLGAFPVRRGSPDRRALQEAEQLLRAGQVIGIFVEGTRRRDLDAAAARPGAAWLAIRNRVPLVPLLIKGPYRIGHPIEVRIGPAFELSEYYDRKVDAKDLDEAGQKIMGKIMSMDGYGVHQKASKIHPS